jgi:DhnA family fructose-bisphosphate aldolase class Ia
MQGKEIRLNRFFSKGENAVVVAVDHGEFDGPLPGFIDLPETVKKIPPQADAILLSPGMTERCGHAFGYKGAPLPIIRLNWATTYCFHWGYKDAATVVAMRPEDAVCAGADTVLVSLTLQTGSEAQDAENVRVFCELTNEAHRLGLLVVGELFPVMGEKISAAKLYEQVYRGCRIIAELGADLIKTFYTVKFREVVESCPVPILGLGAAKLPTELAALELAHKEIRDGARGVVFGRNVIQSKDPTKFVAALCDVVKRGKQPKEAAAKHGLA